MRVVSTFTVRQRTSPDAGDSERSAPAVHLLSSNVLFTPATEGRMCDFTPSAASELLPAIDKQLLYEFLQAASREYQELRA